MDRSVGLEGFSQGVQKTGAIFLKEKHPGFFPLGLHPEGGPPVRSGKFSEKRLFVASGHFQKNIKGGAVEVGSVLAFLISADPSVGNGGGLIV